MNDYTGKSFNLDSGTETDYATLKYDRNGNLLWEQRYNGPGNSLDAPTALAMDKQGNAYVTGMSGGDYATLKYDRNGNLLWEQRYNGPGNEMDDPTAMALDDQGNVYVAGNSYSGALELHYAIVKYYSSP